MIYLIGGPARCGKSTVARRMRDFVHGQIISGDVVVHSLQVILKSEWLPDIYDNDIVGVTHIENLESKIDRLRRRDETMWQFYTAFCNASVESAPQDDILIEGSLWPDYLEGFSHPHKAIFLVDTSDDQFERLLATRDDKDSGNNLTRDYNDEQLKRWAHFNALRSKRYVELCGRYGYPCFDIAGHGMDIAETKA